MIKLLELFGGIGACTQAFKRLGIPFEVADYVEIDKYAVKSYNAINDTNFETQDITKWDKDLDVDFIMHRSPCQDFSIAGKQAGGDEDSGTRSSLMYETIRIVESLHPKYVVWENVKNLLSKKHRHNFDTYLEELNQLGYNNYYQVLNAKDYGIPQNRERVFTVSIRKDIDTGYEFPEKEELTTTLQDILEKVPYGDYYITPEKAKFIQGTKQEHPGYTQYGRYNGAFEQLCRIWKDIAPTLHQKSKYIEIYDKQGNIRQITPKECWRLMGFSDDAFEKAEKVNSNTQLYKQAGNSIVVDVLEKILRNLFKE